MERGGYVYLMTNKSNTVIYTGVTANIRDRVWQHKSKENPTSFCSRYNVNKLVYFEGFNSIEEAIDREKQIKAGSRKRKVSLIEHSNPNWTDLSDGWYETDV